MYCSNCGTEYSDKARFCPKCGTPRRQVTFKAAHVAPDVPGASDAPGTPALDWTQGRSSTPSPSAAVARSSSAFPPAMPAQGASGSAASPSTRRRSQVRGYGNAASDGARSRAYGASASTAFAQPAASVAAAAAAPRARAASSAAIAVLLVAALAGLLVSAGAWAVQGVRMAAQASAQLGALEAGQALAGSILFVALPAVVVLVALFAVFAVLSTLGNARRGRPLPKRATTIAVLLVLAAGAVLAASALAGDGKGASLAGCLAASYAGIAPIALVGALAAAAASKGARALQAR